MLHEIITKINSLYEKRCNNLRSLEDMRYDNRLINPYLKNAPMLNKEEKHRIKERWGRIIPYLSRGYDFFRGVKALRGFSADYLPASYYFPIVECTLNPLSVKNTLSHKSLSQLIYNDIVEFPYTVIRQFQGLYFDCNYNPLTPEKASEIVMTESEPLLYKPSLSTCQGKGIYVMDSDQKQKLINNINKGIIPSSNDFVIQRFVKQSPQTSIFNPSSLNCMRITTLNLNGEISVCSRALKCGPTDSIVDNIGTGKRGVAVGISEDGSLDAFGFYGNGEMTTSHNGVSFKDRKIDNFNQIIEKAKELHSVNSGCKLIGWDLALNADNKVVLIEGNTVCPSISFEQMATGPILGERVDEVIEFIYDNIK